MRVYFKLMIWLGVCSLSLCVCVSPVVRARLAVHTIVRAAAAAATKVIFLSDNISYCAIGPDQIVFDWINEQISSHKHKNRLIQHCSYKYVCRAIHLVQHAAKIEISWINNHLTAAHTYTYYSNCAL